MMAGYLSSSVGAMLPLKSPETKDLVIVHILDLKLSASFPGYSPTGIHDNLYLHFIFTQAEFICSYIIREKKSHNQFKAFLDMTFCK